MNKLSILKVLSAIYCFMATGCIAPVELPKHSIAQNTLEELIQTYDKACQDKDFSVMLACHDPEQRDYYQKYYSLLQHSLEIQKKLTQAIADNIGSKEAELYQQQYIDSISASRFRANYRDKKINWKKVKIKSPKTELTGVYVNREFRQYLIEKCNRWYLYNSSIEQDRENWHLLNAMEGEFNRLRIQMIHKIKTGAVNKNNFKEYFSDLYPDDTDKTSGKAN